MHLSPPCIYVCPLCMDMCSLFLAYTLSEFRPFDTERMSLWVFTIFNEMNRQVCHTMTLSWGVCDFGNIGSWSLLWANRHFAVPKIRERQLDIKKNSAAFGRGFKFFRPIGKILICLPYKCSGTWGTDRHRWGKFGDQAACLWYKIGTWPGCFRSREKNRGKLIVGWFNI